MTGINWREAALVAIAVILIFGSLVSRQYLAATEREILTLALQGASLALGAVLIVRWFIRRKRQNG